MKKFVSVLLLALTVISCNHKSQESAKIVYTVDEDIVYSIPEYTEPDWAEVGSFSCFKDQWLRMPEELLQDTMVALMQDAYNAHMVFNSVYSDLEIFWRWEHETADDMLRMDLSIIKDPETRQMASNFCKNIAAYQKDTTLDWDRYLSEYMDYITLRYHDGVALGIDTTYERFESAMDQTQWVPNYKKLLEKRYSSDEDHQKSLLTALDTTRSFNTRCVYALEYAHSCEDAPYFADAIPYLVKLLTAGQYSAYLYEVWRTWRVLQGMQMGMSKDSEIPNYEYNTLRRLSCYTILCYLHDHPLDPVAVDEFLLLASDDNIRRYGKFMFGNQTVTEAFQIFPAYYRKILDKE